MNFKNTFKNLFIIAFILTLNNPLFAQFNDESEKKLERAIKVITTQYVDSLNDSRMVETAIKAMLSELDPHSKYMSQEETQRNNESIFGSFGGVGIHYQILNDTLTVLKVTKEGPAEKAGIRAGDKIIEIDNESVTNKPINNTFFSSKLRGENGTKVKIKALQHSSKTIKEFELSRAPIAIYTIDAAFMLDEHIGYIKVNGFSTSTMSEFQFATLQLQMQGMEHLIVDLRGNPGGLMKASIDMAALFLPENKLIVYTEGLHYKREEYKSQGNGQFTNGRLVVLMDENSASASEIFAGAMQDWDRGLIVGRRSYGKGLVGRTFTLTDGSSIRLTTGRYYTPCGRSIQKPYVKGEKDEYDKDLRRRFEHGELYNADSISFPDSLKFYTANKRLVYGAGAIMPDIFQAIDTISGSEFFIKFLNDGGMNQFAGLYFDKNLSSLLANYPNYNSFHKNFVVDENTMTGILNFAKEKYQITFTDSLLQKDKAYLETYFKAILARNLFEGGNYIQETSPYDDNLQKAHKIIKDKKLFKEMKVQEN